MIYNTFNAVIDGPDACGKSSIFESLIKDLYHKVDCSKDRTERKSDINFYTHRPAERKNKVDKKDTDNFVSNMEKYMTAFVIGRLINLGVLSTPFYPTRMRKPYINIFDRGLLSTFFYAYAHMPSKKFAERIRSLSGAASKKNSVYMNDIISELCAHYIEFERVIRNFVKRIINDNVTEFTVQTQYNNYEFEDRTYQFGSGISIDHLASVLHTDMTIAIIGDESISDKILERKHILTEDENEYGQIFETNKAFRDDVNTIYYFFMEHCVPKLNRMRYVNPFIGEIVKVCTTQNIGTEGPTWRSSSHIEKDIVYWFNRYLSTNNFTEVNCRGLESYEFDINKEEE